MTDRFTLRASHFERRNAGRSAQSRETFGNFRQHLVGDHPHRHGLELFEGHAFELAIGGVLIKAWQAFQHHRFGPLIRHQSLYRGVDCKSNGLLRVIGFGFALGVMVRHSGAGQQSQGSNEAKRASKGDFHKADISYVSEGRRQTGPTGTRDEAWIAPL